MPSCGGDAILWGDGRVWANGIKYAQGAVVSFTDPAMTKKQPVTLRPAYRRFHYFMVALGLGFVALLLQNVISDKISYQWLILAALAVAAGFVTVKIPGIKIKLSLADIFVFANTILFGPVVGGITAALDGLAGSMRCKSKARRMEFTLFNVAGMALSAYIAGRLFFQILGSGPRFGNRTLSLEDTFLPALILAISYYLLNTMAVAVIVALQIPPAEIVLLIRRRYVNFDPPFAAIPLSGTATAGIPSVL